jgi:hypothetical protein
MTGNIDSKEHIVEPDQMIDFDLEKAKALCSDLEKLRKKYTTNEIKVSICCDHNRERDFLVALSQEVNAAHMLPAAIAHIERQQKRIGELEFKLEKYKKVGRTLVSFHGVLYRVWQIAIDEKAMPQKNRKKYTNPDSDRQDDAALDLIGQLQSEDIDIMSYVSANVKEQLQAEGLI